MLICFKKKTTLSGRIFQLHRSDLAGFGLAPQDPSKLLGTLLFLSGNFSPG
jgi:hypothetical protein